jgi:hypothetical protein
MLGSVNNPLKTQRARKFSSEENSVRHSSAMLFLAGDQIDLHFSFPSLHENHLLMYTSGLGK